MYLSELMRAFVASGEWGRHSMNKMAATATCEPWPRHGSAVVAPHPSRISCDLQGVQVLPTGGYNFADGRASES